MNSENINGDTLKSIKKMYKRYNIIYAANGNLNNGNAVIAICLVIGFEIRDQKSKDLISTNTWISLSHLDIRDKKIILRFPKDSIEFTTSDSQTFFESICDVVQRVLTPKELENLNFSRFNAYPVSPTPFSVRKRISMIKKDKKITQKDEKERVFDFLLKVASNTLDISKFPNLSHLIFKSLPLMSFIQYLIIPELSDTPVYKILDSLLPYCGFLRHIKVSNSIDSHFTRFMTSLIDNKSKISSIGFGPQAELTIDNLREIRNQIVNSRIHSLELNNALSNPSDVSISPEFYTLFDGQLGTQLWSLNMNETKGINFNQLLPKLKFITSLSFENCLIEINEFFSILCNSDMKNLTYLNLNKNDCADKIPSGLKFPPSLTHISVNDVSWKKNSLESFFDFFMKQKDEIHLSIAHALSYTEQWDNLFEYLRNSKCTSFRTLIWDRNPVEDKLINFLIQNDKLSYLSMSECFSNYQPMNEESLILSVANFIKRAQNLKTLIIQGGEIFLGEKFPVIIDACILHPSLSVLDLSNSKCGNVGLGFLIPLIKRGKLNVRILNIEGTYFTGQDPNKCLQLFKEIADSASDVFVSFPEKENEELVENRQIKDKQEFQLLFRSNNRFLEQEEKTNTMDEDTYAFKKFKKSPFYLYPLNYYTPPPFFPVFFEDSDHKQLVLRASRRTKMAQKEEDEEESDFAFVNDNNEQMKYSEVNQRKILKSIIKDMQSPKSPNVIAIDSMALSETEPEYAKNNLNNDQYLLSEYSNCTTTATTTDHSIISNHSSFVNRTRKSKKRNESRKISIEKVSPTKNDENNQKLDQKNDVNDAEANTNKYTLSEFDKQNLKSFKEKYDIKRSIPFPEMTYADQIMDDKWDQIDHNFSLEALYHMLKDQKNTVSNK